MKRLQTLKIFLCLSLSIAILIASCSKLATVGDGSIGIVEMSLGGSSYDVGADVDNRATTPSATADIASPEVQSNTIDLNNGFLMIASFGPEDRSLPKDGSPRDANRANTEITPLATNIRYGLQVYDATGRWVAERIYIRGQEATTQALELDGGLTYTFVVYSINSATLPLPVVTPATATRTLANSTINLTGTQDYMYFRQNLTITGNATNRLDIILKHRFSQITTIINSAQTGYNITAVNSNLSPNVTTATANLSDGNFTRGNINAIVPVIFNTLNNSTITSTPTIMNAALATNISYVIPSITIGPLTQTNFRPFTTLRVLPGEKYNLILNIVPIDGYLTHEGLPAARINGVIWARHNLGVPTTVNPDPNVISLLIQGNFWQWGRPAPSATNIQPIALPFFNTNEPANNAWNAGTELNPIKTAADPCPNRYRLPTATEFRSLLANTVQTSLEPIIPGVARVDHTTIFTSIRNRSVQLTLPAQGSHEAVPIPPLNLLFTSLPRTNLGATGRYHSSTSTNATLINYLHFGILATPARVDNNGNTRASKFISHNIRCVGII